MTNIELQELLKQYPDDWPVYYYAGYDNDYTGDQEVRRVLESKSALGPQIMLWPTKL